MSIPVSITSLVNQVPVRNRPMVLGTTLTLSLGYLWFILVWSGYPLYWGVLFNYCEASQCRESFGYYVPIKSMTPSVMILVLLLGLMGLLLVLFFPLSLFDNGLYCIVQSCTRLYDTYNYYIALLLCCNDVLYYIILCYTIGYCIILIILYCIRL